MGASLGSGAMGWISAPLAPGPGDLCQWTMFKEVIIDWGDETYAGDGPRVLWKQRALAPEAGTCIPVFPRIVCDLGHITYLPGPQYPGCKMRIIIVPAS